MKLSQLLSAITVEEVIGNEEVEITSLECDSRKIGLGSLFVAVRGVNVDGHRFIPIVTVGGVAAIVCEELPERLESTVTYVKVSNSAVALGFLASQWYGNPSRHLKLVGVTGTNGKTTTATLIYEMARLEGYKAGLLSTVVNYIDTEAVHAEQTTPDPLTLNRLLRQMVDAGCEYAAMEVSSHAAHQHRIAGLHFAGGVFTNLTRDHLDYHKTVDAYLAAKKSFFDNLPTTAFALTNADDKAGEVMLQNTDARRYTYSLRTRADFTGKIVESRLDGTLLALNGHEVEVLFTGRFNAYNLTAVYGAALLLGWDPERVLVDMSRLVPVAGRFQPFRSAGGVTAIVDYAHTPDALVNVLSTIRDIVGARGQIITVVGAGGNRDKGKRPIMAREAALRSDRLILTSDNPRDEEPDAIIADMREGLDARALAATLCITDRREAIRTAVSLAKEGDVVLVAGKGHEDYQEIRGVKHHFDDREVVQQALSQL
ncbi:MAG: UDP-N-acetylmuramoyl-L-alanyl-D-glutamate--2,6-diaminopimelate ligase [Paramuribaculum sp.]|nr:UDP-N-acetylmuramoyl-L-alanyl-D-glutamate--2,6-diaminopimelate ligase [Paramuribaculum sp.]MDE5723710.1 UDP-N-acetylmuramoyl-L-alanyl-D-glutamate--2,6-diaminopimelate ligase [Paramuribaculum sp.]